jgi:hypothetical protein
VGVKVVVDSLVELGLVLVIVLGEGVETIVVKLPDIVVTRLVGVPERTIVVRDSPTLLVMVRDIGAVPLGVMVVKIEVGVPLMVVGMVRVMGAKPPSVTVTPPSVTGVPPIVVTNPGGRTTEVVVPPDVITCVCGGGWVTTVRVVPPSTIWKVIGGGVWRIVCTVPPTTVWTV